MTIFEVRAECAAEEPRAQASAEREAAERHSSLETAVLSQAAQCIGS
jgi:hypothetical protein